MHFDAPADHSFGVGGVAVPVFVPILVGGVLAEHVAAMLVFRRGGFVQCRSSVPHGFVGHTVVDFRLVLHVHFAAFGHGCEHDGKAPISGVDLVIARVELRQSRIGVYLDAVFHQGLLGSQILAAVVHIQLVGQFGVGEVFQGFHAGHPRQVLRFGCRRRACFLQFDRVGAELRFGRGCFAGSILRFYGDFVLVFLVFAASFDRHVFRFGPILDLETVVAAGGQCHSAVGKVVPSKLDVMLWIVLVTALVCTVHTGRARRFPVAAVVAAEHQITGRLPEIVAVEQIFDGGSVDGLAFASADGDVPSEALRAIFVFCCGCAFVHIPVAVVEPDGVAGFLLVDVFVAGVGHLVFVFGGIAAIAGLAACLDDAVFVGVHRVAHV